MERFRDRPGIYVANTEKELPALHERLINGDEVGKVSIPEFADKELISAIRDIVLG